MPILICVISAFFWAAFDLTRKLTLEKINSINLLSDGINSFCKNCLKNITINKNNINKHLKNSLMLVTALNKYIGYDNAAKIAKKAFDENLTLKEAAIKLNLVSEKEFDKIVNPKNMI